MKEEKPETYMLTVADGLIYFRSEFSGLQLPTVDVRRFTTDEKFLHRDCTGFATKASLDDSCDSDYKVGWGRS